MHKFTLLIIAIVWAQMPLAQFSESSALGADLLDPPALPILNVSPLNLDFGSVNVGQTVTGEVTVANIGLGVLTLLQPQVTSGAKGGFFVATGLGQLTLAGGESTTFRVGFRPVAVGGPYVGAVEVVSDLVRSTVLLVGQGIDTLAPIVEVFVPPIERMALPGGVLAIAFLSQDNVGVVSQDVALSADGGATFSEVVTNLPGDARQYSYVVPENFARTTQAVLRVTALDAAGNSGASLSSPFTIGDFVPPTVQISVPAGGEWLAAGQPFYIRFSGADDVLLSTFIIAYSRDDGRTFPLQNEIARAGADVSVVAWNVPDNLRTTHGYIRVTAVDAAGNMAAALSGVFTVVAPSNSDQISIITQPFNQSVEVGGTVTFTVNVNGTPPFQYSWRFNGVKIFDATNAVFTITNVQPQDAGKYSVVVANANEAVKSESASLTVEVPAVIFKDNFIDRLVIVNSFTNVVRGDNLNATKEAGEPNHAGKRGGKSVWLCWVAPAAGIATFDTSGSDFDTLLGVYTGEAITNLTEVVSSDDSGKGKLNSRVTFNAVAGTAYHIAIDGRANASGQIMLAWSLQISVDHFPRIIGSPVGRTVATNEALSLEARFDTPGDVQWFFNDQPIPNATGNVLNVGNVHAGLLGRYFARLLTPTPNGPLEVKTFPVQIQINLQPDGTANTNVAARNKLVDASEFLFAQSQQLAAVGVRRVRPSSAPARGYSGTQIFSTYGSTREEGEPIHCDVVGGASEWFSYQAPADGLLTIDTLGSDFDTILAVYTGPGTDFASLTPVACDNDSGPNGTSRVSFSAASNVVYWIVVDGVNGASGTAQLHYELASGPPVITQPPASRSVAAGDNASLTVSAVGLPPLTYQWQVNGVDIPGATGVGLTLANFQAANAGNYRVMVSNSEGSAASATAELLLNAPLRFGAFGLSANGEFQLRIIGSAGTNYLVQCSTNLIDWISLSTNRPPNGIITFSDTGAASSPRRFYRALPAW